MGPFSLEDNPFKTVKGLVDYVYDRKLNACALPSEVHPGGRFWQHFACGFHFRHSLRLPFAAALSVLKGLKTQKKLKELQSMY